jgi:Tol biopolymer transport system component
MIVVLGKPTRRLHLPFDRVDSLAWAPDDRHFAFTARRRPGALFELYTIDVDGRHLRKLTRDLDVTGASWR